VLAAIIAKIETDNLSLAQAQARLRSARADGRSPDYLPSLNATGSATFTQRLRRNQTDTTERNTSYYQAGIDARWELPLYGQLGATRALSRATVALAEADLAAVRASVVSDAVQAYMNLRSSQNQQRLYQQAIVQQTQVVAFTRTLYTAGLVSMDDVNQARRTLASLQTERSRLQATTMGNLMQLARLTGVTEPPASWQAVAPVPTLAIPNFDDTPLDVVRGRPDVRIAESRVLQAAAEANLASAARFPQLVLSGSLAQLDNVDGIAVAGQSITLSGVPTLSIPLLDWGRRQTALRQRKAQLDEQLAAYQETVIGALTEVNTRLTELQSAQEQLDFATSRQADQQSLANASALRLVQGLASELDDLQAQVELARARVETLQTQSGQAAALATLAKALGGGVIPTTPDTHQQPNGAN
jgi:NodT family efflux transporter outer membrane factor (OMF) lipoprotein